MTTKAWPWPGDSPTDAARRIALSYRSLLLLAAADHPELLKEAENLDGVWAGLGANWVTPSQLPLSEDDWLTAREIDDRLNVGAKQVYDWGRRGHVEVEMICGERRYRVGDVIDYTAKRRKERGKHWGDAPELLSRARSARVR